MAPTLAPAFTLRVYFAVNDVQHLGAVKGGPQRMVLPVIKGDLKGKDLEATLLPGGADYLLLDPETQTAHIDARVAFITAEGSTLYVRYDGVLHVDAKSLGPMRNDKKAKSTQHGEHEWFVNPIVETNDPKLKGWAESSMFIGEGRWLVEDGTVGVEYAVYRVGNTTP